MLNQQAKRHSKQLASLVAKRSAAKPLQAAASFVTKSTSSLITPNNKFQKRTFKWSVEKEPRDWPSPDSIIREKEINEMLESTKEQAKNPARVKEILENARQRALLKDVTGRQLPQSEFVQGLTLEEAATLLNVDSNDQELMNALFTTSLFIKHVIYGNRIVLFAPLYLSNFCTQSCVYCGFRGLNKEIPRNKLMDDQVRQEVIALENLGHKRLLMLAGESPQYTFDDFLRHLEIAATTKSPPHGEIRRLNVEIPSLTLSDYRRLKATGHVGTVILFQETYHRETYKKVHPFGMKSDYNYRLLTMDRAQTAGLDDVGLGALFGLYDYRFEVMALLQHAHHLDDTYKAGPHTISIPRLNPANNAETELGHSVNDADFKKLVAIIRCAVPYTGMILTTRETPEMRRELLDIGISQMSAGSKTDVGSYNKEEEHDAKEIAVATAEKQESSCTSKKKSTIEEKKTDEFFKVGQFSLGDHRSTQEVIRELMQNNYMPSFCTACYRTGRTGEKFMKIAKKGDIQNFCSPNSILTLAEYLHDYADEKTKKIGWDLIEKEMINVPSEKRRASLVKKLDQVAKGTRDLYY